MDLQAIRHELSRLRRSYKWLRVGLFVLASATALSITAALFISLDLALRFPATVCWIFWLATVAILCGGVYLLGKTLAQRMTDSAIAVVVERTLPNAHNRLVNAIQLSEQVPHPETFVQNLLAEEDLPLSQVNAAKLVPSRPYKWLGGIFGGAAAVLVLLFVLSPAGAARSTLRLFAPMSGIQPYTETRILAITPGPATVLRGSDLPVQVQLAGHIPDAPVIEWNRGDSDQTRHPLTTNGTEGAAHPGRTVVSGTLEGVFFRSHYRVIAGDARSPWFPIHVTAPPALLDWEAHVTPPKYVGMSPYNLNKTTEDLDIPAGSEVTLRGTASTVLHEVAIRHNGTVLKRDTKVNGQAFRLSFNIGEGGQLRLSMLARNKLESEDTLPFVVLLDQPPTVELVETKQHPTAEPNSKIPIQFEAEDDYGTAATGIEQVGTNGKGTSIKRQTAKATPRRFTGRFVLDLPELDARPGTTLRFRVWADDNAPATMRHRGVSPILTVVIPEPKTAIKEKREQVGQSKNDMVELIRLQRDNLRTTRGLADLAAQGTPIGNDRTRAVNATQLTIRKKAIALLDSQHPLGDLRNVIVALVDHEMAEVVAVLEKTSRVQQTDIPPLLNKAVELESKILAALTGMPQWLEQEQRHQETVDLLAQLQDLTASQKKTLDETRRIQTSNMSDERAKALPRQQDRLANDLVRFTDQCWIVLEGQHDEQLQDRVRSVYDLFDETNLYEKMLTAAEALDYRDYPAAVQTEQTAVSILLKGLDILNKWRVENAKEEIDKGLDTLADIAAKLKDMEAKQAKIAEVTRDLQKRGELNDDVRDLLGKMDREQEAMADMIEQMAQDLYQFPELPVSNELNSKMYEVFEAVEQAADSENAPALEIAVQKEDSFLDAIRKAKERVEDIEMWLPDIPDNIAWNMESFDTDEFPDMPLVPLPDELEDIVGELLDQAADIDQMAQDATGNNMMADGEMGWGIMDGPIPNFSAKGKSGNTRPNDNEMTGRSGAGREGQSVGELVEDHVKGLEGRETHARRTRDPFQKGAVTEDEASTLKARSTGGGKLGGESESEGMFGKAPRRDTTVPDHAQHATALRRETEALYATARLLYLGSGSLGAAAREMKYLEGKTRDLQDFSGLHRKVMRRLQESQVEIANNVVLPMPVSSVSHTGGAAIQDIDISQIDEEYRDAVGEYYKGLQRD
ncbi:MAG: hypothetical protein K9N51_04275 [Candidatus Pacebacteria bacterium]|nr:hypothetical protein [Candidatus Paceibacterota bacterium]